MHQSVARSLKNACAGSLKITLAEKIKYFLTFENLDKDAGFDFG